MYGRSRRKTPNENEEATGNLFIQKLIIYWHKWRPQVFYGLCDNCSDQWLGGELNPAGWMCWEYHLFIIIKTSINIFNEIGCGWNNNSKSRVICILVQISIILSIMNSLIILVSFRSLDLSSNFIKHSSQLYYWVELRIRWSWVIAASKSINCCFFGASSLAAILRSLNYYIRSINSMHLDIDIIKREATFCPFLEAK